METNNVKKQLTNDELSTLAVNALMDKISAMVKKGKASKGLTEDEHAIALAHVVTEIVSLHNETERPLQVMLAIAIRATKNASQMRQVAEKRQILEVTQKGDKTEDVFAQYA